MKNYYRILQVDREAEQEVISAAYRRLTQKYHPDQNPQTEERMKEINEACEVLRNQDEGGLRTSWSSIIPNTTAILMN